jgi:serine/threonine protein kinase
MKLCLICNFQTAGDQDVCPRDGSSMVTVGDDPLLGVVVEGRYKIESVIGQGSAGTVYKAVQELIGREVAIKVLHDYLVSDQEFIKRFTQEAKASSRLSHPNIITIYDFGVIPKGGRPYIAMDLLKGTPLSDMIAEINHLDVEDAVPIFKQVCSALGEAHRQGVVHRDIKPENIVLVERSGQRLFPIVVDFGIARLVQEESDIARITRTGTVCGSPTYMSPEQCTSSKVDHRSDIYSLGVVIYETLTGEVPFLSDELVKVMAMHLSDPPKPLNQVREDLHFSEALEEVVYKSLAKNPDQRYQTMDEFAEALEDALNQPEQQVLPPPPPPRRPEIAPGPLATNDDLGSRRGASKEMIAPRSKPMDLATMALEELRTSGAYEEVQAGVVAAKLAAAARSVQTPDPTTASSTALSHANFQRGRVSNKSIGRQMRSISPKMLMMAVACLALAGAVAYAMNNDLSVFRTAVAPWKASTYAEAAAMMGQGKYEEASIIFKSLKQQGKLAGRPQLENYSKCLIAVAQQYAREKRYDDACSMLNQALALKPSQSGQIKSLLRRYQQINSDR